MSPCSATASPPAQKLPEHVIEAGRYPTTADAFDHALVVLAAGHSCWLVPEQSEHRLLVEPAAIVSIREQLDRFDREATRWPPAPLNDPLAVSKFDLGGPFAWAALLLASFWAQGKWPQLLAFGALDAHAFVAQSEWWRAFTALFLHADADHILANLFTGVFIFPAVLSVLGNVRGWLLLLAASVSTNALIAFLSYPGPYRSLGASTAIFAALGLLTSHAIGVVARSSHPHRWRAMFVPFAAGLIALALYGAGGQNVDLSAHAVGFAMGLAVGLIARPRQS